MEWTEYDTADSLEELITKSEDSSESDSAEKTTHIRFLVSKEFAGSLIGKGGSTINEFQENSGARILISRNGEYFPGTTDRIVVISGTLNEVYTAVGLVLGKLRNKLQAEDGSDVELRRTRIVVPHSSVICIMGKGGAIIKSIVEYSTADIKISPMDNTYFGLSDRLLTLSGTMDVQMCAIYLILNKLTENDGYSLQVHSPNSFAGRYHYGFHGCNSVNYARSPLGSIQDHKEGEFNSVTIPVSDEYTGMVLGRNGRNIKQINLLTGARIKISSRSDFISGTTDRKLTISGLQSSIDSAKLMIQYKIDSVSGEGQGLH